MLKRKVVHVDMDCFYAAVEARDNPQLRGRPLVVGGKPNSRGVVATCSYEARKFGVRSAMASALALKLCPEAIFVSPNFTKYKEVSGQIRSIFQRYTDKIEPLSLDEAYLDVTGHDLYATKIAQLICSSIANELCLTASAGVAPNKLIAKIASDTNKPNGITVVRPHEAAAFMAPLKLRKINGIGPVTEKRLASLGLLHCRDVLEKEEGFLVQHLGERFAYSLTERCQGIDKRGIESTGIRKSLSYENTFSNDIASRERIHSELTRLASKVSSSLKSKHLAGKTITLKAKYFDFKQVTRSKTIGQPSNCSELITSICIELLGKTQIDEKPVRLLGIGVSGFVDEAKEVSLAQPNPFLGMEMGQSG
ncbi:MAG: DNA polymerase IV [Oligoflexales bacterium]|nr:DNA polymerase IV [Oligoflexales bacterium]